MRIVLALAVYFFAVGCMADDLQDRKPTYIIQPRPVYLPPSVRLGEEGTVIVRALVNENGEIDGVGIHKSSGFSRLDDAALAAVAKAKIEPYRVNGRAIRSYFFAPVGFKLDQSEPPKPLKSPSEMP